MAKKTLRDSVKASDSRQTIHDFLSNNKKLLLLIGLFSLLLYGNTIRNRYALDDVYVTNNEQVKRGFGAIPEILTSFYATNVYEDGQQIMFGYRPVVKTTFAIEYGIFGDNPHVSHFINIILYFLLCVIVFNFLKRIFRDQSPIIPLIVTFLFAANPLHTEVVASLKNRDELLSALFGFMALSEFLKFADTGKWIRILIGFVLFVLAYYSKMSALLFIPLIPLSLYFFSDVKLKKVFLVLGVLLITFVAIRLLNRSFLPVAFRPKQYIENPLLTMSMMERLPSVFNILLFYLKKLIVPTPLLFYYGYDTIEISTWSSLKVIVSVIIHLSLLGLGLWGLRKKKIYSFFILFYLMVIALYSNLLKPPMGIVADRFLFVAVLPFFIALVYLVNLLIQNKVKVKLQNRYLIGIMGAILVFYSIVTIDRNKDWYDQKSLVENDIEKLEKSARANFIYAGMLKAELYEQIQEQQKAPSRAKVNEIKKYLDRAVAVYPDFYKAWDMLGTVYFVLERNEDKAIECFERSISIKRNYISAYQNLAFLYISQGKLKKASRILEKAYRIRPGNKTTLADLADVYARQGNEDKAAFYRQKLGEEQNRKSDRRFPRGKRFRF